MNEPRKTALAGLIVLAIVGVVFVIEFLRSRVSGWMALIIVSLILLVLALSIHPIRAQGFALGGAGFTPPSINVASVLYALVASAVVVPAIWFGLKAVWPKDKW